MKCEGKEIVSRLDRAYKIKSEDFLAMEIWEKTRDPFKVLIATILTQNTTDKGAKKAYEELDKEVGITAEGLSRADPEVIKRCIRKVGLHNNKTKVIKEVSMKILNEYGGDINKVLDLGLPKAREKLVELPGVGKKTADVLLITCRDYPVFPIDTHIFRISKRLGVDGNYDKVSSFWREVSDNLRLRAHLLLITHGRATCKAIKPKCDTCVLNDCCEYYARLRGSQGPETS
ncbi:MULTISPECIES: endonuclease III [Metallosphaera]|uniref:endonuclease III domain-containing protein n=1 Tax=Metallosphaera TaxID=41980 RepID=UPI001F05E440|nr:endonuclease III [Metallosphaera sedula]MCH1770615.1 endonuclease III [Metallosphaera sedula]MCP6728813.1 endonuclease III [Metallosphaera sedula]